MDYQEVFAPAADNESIHILLTLAAHYDLKLDQMNVCTPFLNGDLNKEIYMIPPDGFKCPPGCIWKLKHLIYGLKQASHVWNIHLYQELEKIGFAHISAEHCLYVYWTPDRKLCFLVVYVDDLLLAANSQKFMDNIKQHIGSVFKTKDLGSVQYILGIEILHDCAKHTISLSQCQYVKKILA